MDLGALLLLIAVLLITAAIVTRPFLADQPGRRNSTPGTAAGMQPFDQQVSTLLAEKEHLLNIIQELDFDRDTGKIPQDLYQANRTEMLQQAAGLLMKLDELGYKEPEKKSAAAHPAGKRAEYDDLDELIARRRLAKTSKAEGFCAKCGSAIQATDRFCPKCGKTVERQP